MGFWGLFKTCRDLQVITESFIIRVFQNKILSYTSGLLQIWPLKQASPRIGQLKSTKLAFALPTSSNRLSFDLVAIIICFSVGNGQNFLDKRISNQSCKVGANPSTINVLMGSSCEIPHCMWSWTGDIGIRLVGVGGGGGMKRGREGEGGDCALSLL